MIKDIRKKAPISVLVMIGAIILFSLQGEDERGASLDELHRNSPGNGNSSYVFNAQVDDVTVSDIRFLLSERDYTFDECKALAPDFEGELRKSILGNNESFERIEEDMVFKETIPGYPFKVSYQIDAVDKVGGSGEILYSGEFKSVLTVDYAYESFKSSMIIDLYVSPGSSVKEKIYKKRILALLEAQSDEEGDIVLPSEVDGKKVSFEYPEKSKSVGILFIGLVASVLILVSGSIDSKKEQEKRKSEMLREYPVMLQKISLYLATGMTIRNIWTVVCEEGVKKYGSKHPLYSEMEFTANEIQSGVSEGMAYKRFGERTGLTELIRFTALLSQNLKRGSSHLGMLLDEESSKAFTEKKQRAISAGEKAGTKLLIPMMLLLVDVLLVIMIPAFWSI